MLQTLVDGKESGSNPGCRVGGGTSGPPDGLGFEASKEYTSVVGEKLNYITVDIVAVCS